MEELVACFCTEQIILAEIYGTVANTRFILARCFMTAISHNHTHAGQNITWNGQVVRNNSLVTLSAVPNRVSSSAPPQYPLVCQGITGGQWYEPSGVLFPLAMPDMVNVTLPHGGLGQQNVSGGVELYRGTPPVFPHGVQCCTNTTITLCVGMYSDPALANSSNLATSNGYNYGLSVAATYVLWTTNGSPVSNTSSQIVTDRPTSTYNNTLTVTGRAYGMYTCTVTTTCSPVCGGFTLNPRSTTSSLTVQTPPGPPTGVTAVQSGPTSVNVSWTAPTSGGPVTRYDIYYVANGGPSTSGDSTNSTSYVLTKLQVGVQYNISVIAVGTSLPSLSANVTRTLILCSYPIIPLFSVPLNITQITSTSITVMWSQPGGEIGTTYTLSYTYQGPCAGAGGGGSVSVGNATQYNITGLQEFSAYIFTITASIGVGSSPPASVLVNTSSAAPSAPPNNLTEVSKTSSSVTISWEEVPCQDQNSVIVEYSVLYGAVTSGVGGTVTTSGRTLTVNGLSPYTNYSIEVSAVNSDGVMGPYSSLLFVVTEGSPTSAAGGAAIGGAVGGVVGGVVLVLIAATVVIVIVILLRCRGHNTASFVTNTSPYEKVKKTTSHTTEMDTIDTGNTKELPPLRSFPLTLMWWMGRRWSSMCVSQGYPRSSFTWYQNGTKMTTDHSFTLGEDGSLVIHTAEMGHAGVYELEVANELGVDRRRVSLGVYGSEIELPGDYQMTVPAVLVAKFGPYVAKSHEKNNTGFNNQYRSLESTTKRPSTVALSSENKSLNRFANIVPYDENLIQLSPMEGQQDCQRSYINASYIAGYSEPKKFIATQGPLPSTVVDLWRLMWQEGVSTIVMVTNIKEDGKVKCQQYWAESGHQKYGPFSVAITEQKDFADYVIRVFEVTLSGSAARKVTQFHFTGWPDHGVPEYATSVLAFHRKVKSQHDGSKGPILVHCSAGVGRTGTLIAIGTVLEQIEKEGLVDIAGTIRKMRRQRMKMVQTPDQYIFLHDAILESVMCGNTQIQASNIHIALNTFETKDPTSNKTGLESQFEVLEQVSPDPKSVRRDVALEEAGKNRSMDYLPPDRYRVILKQEYPDYINATFVNGYKQQKAFIIAQGPLKSTCRDFWKMACDRKCGAIVMLSQLEEGGKEVCHQYWPDQGIEIYGEFTIESGEQEARDGYTIRTLYLATAKSTQIQQVTQFHITNWSPDGVCTNLATITDVIEEVDKVQRRTGNQPIVVHCSDTVGRSGMFCAITMVTQQCKTEGVVDVFQTVKSIRTQKPGAVLTVDQYQGIFKTMVVLLDHCSTNSLPDISGIVIDTSRASALQPSLQPYLPVPSLTSQSPALSPVSSLTTQSSVVNENISRVLFLVDMPKSTTCSSLG
ncbi:hypothetical protein EMCRGX_G018943 [Ephydatia muelleri]